jgi:CheY-like chemotaxis protein
MTNLVENAWRAGADQCLMKASTTPAQLFDVVNKAIQKAAARMAGSAPPTPLSRSAPGMTPLPPVAPLAPQPLRSPPPASTMPVAPSVTPLQRPPTQPPFTVLGRPPGASPAPALASASVVQPEVDPEFQAQIRALFVAGAPAKLADVREAATAFVQDQGSSMQLPLLMDLFRKIHSLTGNAAVAGCAPIAHYASTFEAFLQELQQKPKFINVSTVCTVANSVEFVERLFQYIDQTPSAPAKPASILVVDGDAMSSQAIVMALEKAEYQTSIAGDPIQALGMFSAGAFDSVVMAVDLPGMSGFELCAQMQTSPAYSRTPVLFVTSLNDFPTHAVPEVLGDNDLIAKPFLLIELTLKAVTRVEWARLQE